MKIIPEDTHSYYQKLMWRFLEETESGKLIWHKCNEIVMEGGGKREMRDAYATEHGCLLIEGTNGMTIGAYVGNVVLHNGKKTLELILFYGPEGHNWVYCVTEDAVLSEEEVRCFWEKVEPHVIEESKCDLCSKGL